MANEAVKLDNWQREGSHSQQNYDVPDNTTAILFQDKAAVIKTSGMKGTVYFVWIN